MENMLPEQPFGMKTCLMGYRLPKWRIYNPLEESAIGYSFLLKQKREFQQFIDQLGNQVSLRNTISSCCIIDKVHSTADGKNVNIYIFDSSEFYKCLQLKISIPKQYLKRKIHLLIHLSSKNNAVSKLKDQCMYIKCKEGQIWKTFYNFFEFLFQKSSENIIGVQFYTPLMSKYLIAKELSFLLSPSSKYKCVNTRQNLNITAISKQSSLSALIKASPKNSIKPIGVLKHRVATKNVPGYMFEFLLKQKSSCSVTLKRKSIDSENESWIKTMKVKHEFCKKVPCQCHKRNKWKMFKQIHKQTTINYTELLEAKNALENSELNQILSNQPEKSHTFNTMKTNQNIAFEMSVHDKTNSKFVFSKDKKLSFKSPHQITDIATEIKLNKVANINVQNEFEQPNKDTESSLSQCTANIFANYNRNMYSKAESEEAGKKYCIDSSNVLIGDEFKEICLSPVYSSIAYQGVNNKKCNATCKWPIEFPSTCMSKVPSAVSMDQQPMGFLTAAGKSLNVSEKAILVAQKMFEEVCSQEIGVLGDMTQNNMVPSTSVSKKRAYPGENYLENEFNSDFADKFFEEMPFDDKEIETEPKENVIQVSNLNSIIPEMRKVRKSLGGRRSLKPYTLQK